MKPFFFSNFQGDCVHSLCQFPHYEISLIRTFVMKLPLVIRNLRPLCKALPNSHSTPISDDPPLIIFTSGPTERGSIPSGALRWLKPTERKVEEIEMFISRLIEF